MPERISPEAQHFFSIHYLCRAAARFGVLPCDSSNSDNGESGTPDKNKREGKDESDFVGNISLSMPKGESKVISIFQTSDGCSGGAYMSTCIEAFRAIASV